ncbi:MAG TPA: 23S rRNA (guanosine(2251)-2'-O)-methyltransferase RlmB [Cyclobacteriaceae bacterium]|nr:23S rRNA (guanosine(2251)-2'-O)-methyltransferase RlmB [Cyclobacteriaceae bacterium]
MEKKDLIYGTRAVTEAVRSGKEVEKVFIQQGLNNDLLRDLLQLLKEHQIPFSFVPLQKLNKLGSRNHQGVLCYLSAISYASLENIIQDCFDKGKEPFIIILDRVTDVRNFGAIARTAECAGADAIVIPDKGSAAITSDAMKTSAGALNYIPVCRVKDLAQTIRFVQESGLQVIACTEKSNTSIYKADFSQPCALLFGSEEDGISDKVLRIADQLVQIPQHGKISSLNVSVAAGIAIFEALRQKKL